MEKKVQINSVTGLTATQEKACSMLASGEPVEAVAKEINVPEQTLYLWQKQKTFKCYYNKRRSIIRDVAAQSLFALANEAVRAVRDSLNSTNESVKLKAATYILEKLQDVEVGTTDIIEAVKAEATYTETDLFTGGYLHRDEYERNLEKLGIAEQTEEDYRSSLK